MRQYQLSATRQRGVTTGQSWRAGFVGKCLTGKYEDLNLNLKIDAGHMVCNLRMQKRADLWNSLAKRPSLNSERWSSERPWLKQMEREEWYPTKQHLNLSSVIHTHVHMQISNHKSSLMFSPTFFVSFPKSWYESHDSFLPWDECRLQFMVDC